MFSLVVCPWFNYMRESLNKNIIKYSYSSELSFKIFSVEGVRVDKFCNLFACFGSHVKTFYKLLKVISPP